MVNNRLTSEEYVLVLGASGLIGSACVRRLKYNGYKNVLSPAHDELDLKQADAITKYFSNNRVDFIILAAGLVGGIADNSSRPYDYIAENLHIFLNVCTNAKLHQVKRIVLLGSSCMYPLNTQQPIPASALYSGELEATSLPYAISKLASITFGLSFNKQFNSDKYLTIIPNSTYGPGDNFDGNSGHVLSALISKFHLAKEDQSPFVKLWGSGTPRREFVYSEDLADAIIFILEKGIESQTEPINVGVGHDVSIADLASIIKNVVGFTGKIEWDKAKPDGAPKKLLDSSLIKSLGWRPKFDLQRGIKYTYESYLANLRR